MKSSKALSVVVVAALAALGAFGLSSCSGSSDGSSSGSAGSGSVAVTVNGTEILEDTITDYIQQFRTAQAVDEDEAWGTWLATYGMTPSDVRSDVIDYFVGQELVKEAAEEEGVEVTEEEVEEQVSQMKANYSDDDAWSEALDQVGTTEDEYRDNVRSAMLESKLQEKIIEEYATEATDEELIEQAGSFAPYFDGAKKSSHILFNAEDQEQAQQVLDQINNGELAFEDAVAEYSQDTGSAANGGDVGWDMLNSFVTEYTDALAELGEGETSGLVESDFGYHIIRCTQVFNAPDEITSLDQLPPELVEYVREMVDSSADSEAYTNWFEEYKEGADIQINDMPEGLPYDIDASLYETPEDEDAEGEASEGDATIEADDAEVTVETEGEDLEADAAVEADDQAASEADADAEAEAEADQEADEAA